MSTNTSHSSEETLRTLTRSNPNWRLVVEPALVFLLLLSVYWAGNGRTNLWDRDEPRYAGTAHNMLKTGDFIVPYFNGNFRFTKPVMTYWIVAAAFQIFGESEFVARMPAGLAVALSCLIVYRLGNRYMGRPAGLLAALMLGLSPMAMFLGKLCLPDGPQFLFGTIAFGCLWKICSQAQAPTSQNHRELDRAAFALWLSMGFAILTKGPIVPGMVAATLLLHKVLTGMPWSAYRMRWAAGSTTMLLTASPWYAAMYALTGTLFFNEAAGRQLMGRVSTAFDKTFWPPGYYAVTVAGCILPWLGLFWLAVKRSYSQIFRDSNLTFLFAWTFGSMAIFEIFRSKQPHYFAPAYPAIALFVADFLARAIRKDVVWHFDSAARRLVLLGAVLAGVGTVALVVWTARLAGELNVAWWIAAGGLGMAAVIAGFFVAANRLHTGISLAAVSATLTWFAVSFGLLPALSSKCVARPAALRLAKAQSMDLPIVLHRVFEPSLTYYSDMPLPAEFHVHLFVRNARSSTRGVLSLLTESDLREVSALPGDKPVILDTWSGMLKMHGETVHLVHIPPAGSMETTQMVTRPSTIR